MPPAALSTLFCDPNDVFDFLSVEGAELRLDDKNLSTGQTITVAVDAPANATTLQIGALQWPLIKGTTLEFSGGGMTAVVKVVLTATAVVGATALTVSALPDDVNATATADDSGLNVAMANRLVKACNYGTAEVKLWCNATYDDSSLVQSWSVNRWATAVAAQWICKRCCRSMPKGVESEAEETADKLKLVQRSLLRIEDIGTRTAAWPFIDAHSVDPGFFVHKNRIERSMSEQTPTQFNQFVDYADALSYDWGYW